MSTARRRARSTPPQASGSVSTSERTRAQVAERQAKEDALVQKRIEEASDYVGTRAEANR